MSLRLGGHMQSEKNSRVDTGELKAQLLKKVGEERFKMYFHFLSRFINQKLSKSEFDKSCFRILGRENLPLHNQLIRVILKNASSSKTPPPKTQEAGPTNKVGIAGGNNSPVRGGHGQNHSSFAPIWSNGVIPISPRKGKSTVRDRKLKDRQRPPGPNGKVNSVARLSTATNGICGKATLENGDLGSLHRPRGLAEQSESVLFRRHLVAPLGISSCSASTDIAQKTLPATHIGDYLRCSNLGGLFDSEALRRRMEQILAAQGLGVTLECANTLNNMVDVHLKRLVKSCLELVGSKSPSDPSTYSVQKQQIHAKPINGLRQSNHLHVQNSGGAVEAQRFNQSVSLLDFKVAMELNPRQLGENWPLLLEKISMQGFVD